MNNPAIGDIVYVDRFRVAAALTGLGQGSSATPNYIIGLIVGKEDFPNWWWVYTQGKLMTCYLIAEWYHSIDEEPTRKI